MPDSTNVTPQDPKAQTTAPPTPPPPGSEPGAADVQKRINQLTSRASQAESQADFLTRQNQVLAEQIAELRRASTPAPEPRPTTSFEDLFNPPQSRGSSKPGPQDIQSAIDMAVQRALQPVIQQQQRAQAEQQLIAAQQRALNEAMEFLPDLERPDSEASKIFEDILAGNPELRMIPRAPLIIANAVTGLLRNNAQQKMAASPPAPSGGLNRLPSTPTTALQDQELLNLLYKKAAHPEVGGQGQTLNPQEADRMIQLRMRGLRPEDPRK